MTIQHVKTEIQMQKELERARDDRTDEKLLSVSLADLTTILKIYETDPLLKEKSKQYAQIKSLVKQAEHWDKPEAQRKWFHF